MLVTVVHQLLVTVVTFTGVPNVLPPVTDCTGASGVINGQIGVVKGLAVGAPLSIHGSPRVKTLPPGESAGSGAPPSVQVRPPSVEKENPETPGGFSGVQAKPKGGPQNPCASLKPARSNLPLLLAATVVSERPRKPF